MILTRERLIVNIFLTRRLSKALTFCEFASINFKPCWTVWSKLQHPKTDHLTFTTTSMRISWEKVNIGQMLTLKGNFENMSYLDDLLHIGQVFNIYTAHITVKFFQRTYQQLGMTILGLTAKTFVSRS